MQLWMSTTYHPQTDDQPEVLNRFLEIYLCCFTLDRPKDWIKWLGWAEFSYNTVFHYSAYMTPFQVVYNRPLPSIMQHLLGDCHVDVVRDMLMDRDETLRLSKTHLLAAHQKISTKPTNNAITYCFGWERRFLSSSALIPVGLLTTCPSQAMHLVLRTIRDDHAHWRGSISPPPSLLQPDMSSPPLSAQTSTRRSQRLRLLAITFCLG